MKTYTITWDEKKFRTECGYFSKIICNDREAARDIYFAEQDRRRLYDLPHMFHVKIGMKVSTEGRTYKQIEDRRPRK